MGRPAWGMEQRSSMSRVAVVTGGGSGMGRAICHQLAEQGHRVAVLDIDGDAADAVAPGDHRPTAAPRSAAVVDVSDRAAIEAALDEVRAAFGPIEIMVTSAGIEGFAEFLDITAEAWDRMMAVNLTGTFHCLQAAVPDMIEARWGRIVTISSSSAQSGTRRMSHYVASKGGVIALHQGARPRPGTTRHHGEHDPARRHRHPDDAAADRAGTMAAWTR